MSMGGFPANGVRGSSCVSGAYCIYRQRMFAIGSLTEGQFCEMNEVHAPSRYKICDQDSEKLSW